MEYISIFNSHDANFVKIRVCKISLITADIFNFRAVARFSNPGGWICNNRYAETHRDMGICLNNVVAD